jgi:hypothetical protein
LACFVVQSKVIDRLEMLGQGAQDYLQHLETDCPDLNCRQGVDMNMPLDHHLLRVVT